MKIYNEKEPFTYCGFPNPPFNKSKAVIAPIPYEGTVCYGSGTAQGPQAIIDASRHMEPYDIELGVEIFEKVLIHTLGQMETNYSSPEAMVNDIEKSITKLIKYNKFPVILGGEHSITTVCVRSFNNKYKELTVVQLDAHADLKDEWQGSKYSHAFPMRRCREMTNVVQVGIRSMEKSEADYIKENKIEKSIFYSPDLPVKDILKQVGKNVYLTIDLDVLNPALMPAVGTPEPGGLTWYPFISFLKELFKQRNVVGADIVELAPISGIIAPNFMASVIAYKLIGYKFFAKRK